MDDPKKKASQHETDGGLRRNTRTTSSDGIKISNIFGQPAEIEHPVDAGKDMIIRHKVTQRPADEKLELIPVLMTNHSGFRDKILTLWNQQSEGFSTAPRGTSAKSFRTHARWHLSGQYERR